MDYAFESYSEADEERNELFSLNKVSEGLMTVRNKIALEGMCRDDATLLEQHCPGLFANYSINKFTALSSSTGLNVALEAIDWKRTAIVVGVVGAALALLVKFFSWLAGLLSGNKIPSGGGGITDIDVSNNRIKEYLKPMSLEEAASAPERNKISSFYSRYAQLANFNVNNMYLSKMQKYAETSTFPKKVIPDDLGWAITNYLEVTNRVGKNLELQALYGHIFMARDHGVRAALDMLDWDGSSLPKKDRLDLIFLASSVNLTSLAIDVVAGIRAVIGAISRVNPDKTEMVVDPIPELTAKPPMEIWDGRSGAELQHVWVECELLIKAVTKLGDELYNNPTYDWIQITAGARKNLLQETINENLRFVISPKYLEIFAKLREDARIVPTFHYKGGYSKVEMENRAQMKMYTNIFESLATAGGREQLSYIYHTLKDVKAQKESSVIFVGMANLSIIMNSASKEFNELKSLIVKKQLLFPTEPIWRNNGTYRFLSGTTTEVHVGYMYNPMDAINYGLTAVTSLQKVFGETLAAADIICKVTGNAVNEMEDAAKELGALRAELEKYED